MNQELPIKQEDLRLVGKFYCNDFPLELETTSTAVCIIPARTTTFAMAGMMIICALVYSLLAGPLVFFRGANLDPLLWTLLVLVGLLAIGGPLAGHQLRLRYLRKLSPLLEYNSVDRSIAIHAGAQRFPVEQVMGILGVATSDKDGAIKSELQLLTKEQDRIAIHLIATSLTSFPKHTFGKILREFHLVTKVRCFIAQPTGLLMRGDPRIEELVAVPSERVVD